MKSQDFMLLEAIPIASMMIITSTTSITFSTISSKYVFPCGQGTGDRFRVTGSRGYGFCLSIYADFELIGSAVINRGLQYF